MPKIHPKESLSQIASTLFEQAGDFVEHSVENHIEKRGQETPLLDGEPENGKWYRIHLPGGLSGDGSEYHIYLKKGTLPDLCIFLSGGGMAWDANSASLPVTGGRIAAGVPNYYWNNLRPFTQVMNIHFGLTEAGNPHNPFDQRNFIVITYATGDFHLGSGVSMAEWLHDGVSGKVYNVGEEYLQQNIQAQLENERSLLWKR